MKNGNIVKAALIGLAAAGVYLLVVHLQAQQAKEAAEQTGEVDDGTQQPG
jgi:mannose/fructose/N-acetylgalactosamine-specific phosphotransferase system component IIC